MPDNPNISQESTGWDLLATGSKSLGLCLSQRQIDAFRTYLDLITLWNSRMNLTAIREPEAIIRLHFLDSLAIVRFLAPDERLLDLGSGAGFPGIPIKILYPDKQVVLVEAHGKKANFLREVIRKLKLKKIQIVGERAEKLSPREIGFLKELITRASGPLENLLRIAAPLLAPGGSFLIMSGPSGLKKFNAIEARGRAFNLGFKPGALEEYRLPIGQEARTLLTFTRY